MIIILEGPDGGGKTTLAAQLSNQTGYPIVRRGYPKTNEEKQQMLQEYIDIIKKGKNVIFDRSWYSEIVYGPIMRDDSVITYPAMYELERLLAKAGAIVIYCTGAKNTLWKRCQKRGEDYIVSRDIFDSICDAYDEVMDMPHYIPILKYVYKDL